MRPLLFASLAITGLAVAPAFADDRSECDNFFGKDEAARAGACSRLIHSGKFKGAELAGFYENHALASLPFDKALIDVLANTATKDLAIADYSQAIKLDPLNPRYLSARGDLYRSKAQVANRSTSCLSPAETKSVNGDVTHCSNKDLVNRAIADLDEAIRLKADAISYFQRGKLRHLAGDDDRAIDDFNEAIRINSTSLLVDFYYKEQGTSYEAKNNLDAALADYRKALSISSDLSGVKAKSVARLERKLATNAAPAPPLVKYTAEAADFWKKYFEEHPVPSPAPSATPQPAPASEPKPSPPTVAKDPQPAVVVPPHPPSPAPAIIAARPEPPAASPAPLAAPRIPAVPGRRVALVIGNDNYDSVPKLQKAVNNSRTIGDHLSRLGFEVIRAENASRRIMSTKITELAAKIGPGDTAFFFYAGHGVAIRETNYLLPTDIPAAAEGQEDLIASEGIGADIVIDAMQRRGARVTLLVLDACRDNPFKSTASRGIGGTRGLTEVKAPEGVFVLYSAGIGQTALDRLSDTDANPNSVFTRTFAGFLDRTDLSLQDVAKETQTEVKRLAGTVSHVQMPAYYDQIDGRLALGAK